MERKWQDELSKYMHMIRESEEVQSYHRSLILVKSNPTLYRQVCEYRKELLELKIKNPKEWVDSADSVGEKYNDMWKESIVKEFLDNELRMCKLVRTVKESFYQAIDLEIDFLDH